MKPLDMEGYSLFLLKLLVSKVFADFYELMIGFNSYVGTEARVWSVQGEELEP